MYILVMRQVYNYAIWVENKAYSFNYYYLFGDFIIT